MDPEFLSCLERLVFPVHLKVPEIQEDQADPFRQYFPEVPWVQVGLLVLFHLVDPVHPEHHFVRLDLSLLYLRLLLYLLSLHEPLVNPEVPCDPSYHRHRQDLCLPLFQLIQGGPSARPIQGDQVFQVFRLIHGYLGHQTVQEVQGPLEILFHPLPQASLVRRAFLWRREVLGLLAQTVVLRQDRRPRGLDPFHLILEVYSI